MRKASEQFLQDLLAAPGPSGYEGPVRAVWKAEVETYADAVEVDVHGNAIAVYNADAKPRVMLAGHIDELGFQVIYIDDKGYIYFETIGGFDLGMVPGRKVRIHTRKGAILGVLGKKPIHLMKGDERNRVPAKHELWIDIGVGSGDEAKELVEIGDPATYDPNFEISRGLSRVARDGQQGRGLGRGRGDAPRGARQKEMSRGAFLCGDGTRRSRAARRQDQRLWGRSTGGHCRRCDLGHGSSRRGQTPGGGMCPGRWPGDQPRCQYQSGGF